MNTNIGSIPGHEKSHFSRRIKQGAGCLAAGGIMAIFAVVGGFYGGSQAVCHLVKSIRHALIPSSNTVLETEFRLYFERKQQVNKLILLERRSMEKVIRNITTNYTLPGLFDPGIFGQASVSIRCPVIMMYYVDLQEVWRFKIRNQIMEVWAPQIRIAPPAIDPGRIEREINGGWLVFGEAAQLAGLEKELQVELRLRAMKPENMALFRDDCRQALEKFIRTWLLASPHQIKQLKIIFNGETPKDHGVLENAM